MKHFKLMVAAAALAATMSGAVSAEAMGQRAGYDSRYERDGRYRSDRDRHYDRRDRDRRADWRDRDRRGYDNRNYDRRDRDRRDYDRNSSDVARRNYELERDLQTCYRDGKRICPN